MLGAELLSHIQIFNQNVATPTLSVVLEKTSADTNWRMHSITEVAPPPPPSHLLLICQRAFHCPGRSSKEFW